MKKLLFFAVLFCWSLLCQAGGGMNKYEAKPSLE